jgi:hypothetical protein
MIPLRNCGKQGSEALGFNTGFLMQRNAEERRDGRIVPAGLFYYAQSFAMTHVTRKFDDGPFFAMGLFGN